MLTPPSVTEIRRPTTQEEEIQKDAHAIRAVREHANMRTLADFSVFFQLMLSYRVPMRVKDAILLPRRPHDYIFYYCPRCQHLLERDFVAYCCSCGQCIDWHGYQKAKLTRFKPKE